MSKVLFIFSGTSQGTSREAGAAHAKEATRLTILPIDHGCPKDASRPLLVRGQAAREMLGDEVEDDGPGLDPEAAQSAVGRGIRFDADAPGSGLGLSIAAGLTELYSGTLTLERGRISTDDQVGDVMLVEQREQISEV